MNTPKPPEQYRAELTENGCIVMTIPCLSALNKVQEPVRHTISLDAARALYNELKDALVRADKGQVGGTEHQKELL